MSTIYGQMVHMKYRPSEELSRRLHHRLYRDYYTARPRIPMNPLHLSKPGQVAWWR